MLNKEEARKQALKELDEEQLREAIEQEKERIRKRVPLWHHIFPWIITIKRRG